MVLGRVRSVAKSASVAEKGADGWAALERGFARVAKPPRRGTTARAVLRRANKRVGVAANLFSAASRHVARRAERVLVRVAAARQPPLISRVGSLRSDVRASVRRPITHASAVARPRVVWTSEPPRGAASVDLPVRRVAERAGTQAQQRSRRASVARGEPISVVAELPPTVLRRARFGRPRCQRFGVALCVNGAVAATVTRQTTVLTLGLARARRISRLLPPPL